MKLGMTLAVLVLVALAFAEARPRGKGGKGGKGKSGGDRPETRKGGHGGGRGSHEERPSGVIACLRTEVDGGVVKENVTSKCPDEYPCTVQGLQITIAGKINEIGFCSTPFPSPRMACAVHLANGTTIDGRKKCDDAEEECSTNQHTATGRDGNNVTFSICVPKGATVDPTQPDYSQILLRRACNIDGQSIHNCSRKGVCDGASVTVAGKVAQFCKKDDSSEEAGQEIEYLELFKGKCGRRGGKDSKSSSEEEVASESSDSSSSDESVSTRTQGGRGGQGGGRGGGRRGGNRRGGRGQP